MSEQIDRNPYFAAEVQQTFTVAVGPLGIANRVFDRQTQREGTYEGRLAGWGDVALVTFDGDTETTEVSFTDIRNLYR